MVTLKKPKSKSTLTGDFLFEKEPAEGEERPEVVNKEALA